MGSAFVSIVLIDLNLGLEPQTRMNEPSRVFYPILDKTHVLFFEYNGVYTFYRRF